MQKVKMLELRLPAIYKEEIKSEVLLQYYEKHGTLTDQTWYYEHYRPKSATMDSADWKKYVEESFEEVKEKYPRFDHTNITIQFSQYADIIDAFIGQGSAAEIIKSYFVSVTPDADGLIGMIKIHTELMQKQMEQLNQLSDQTFNNKCNVSVTDTFLFQVNQTMLLEDCCTDHLQKQLQDGWRILTICPQPNQRRPDYILGKYVDEPEYSAIRS